MRIKGLFSTWQLLVRRSVANWRLLSSVVVGVVLASAMLAGTAIYFEALRDLALDIELEGLSPVESNVVLSADRGPTNWDNNEAISEVVDSQTGPLLGRFLRGQDRAGRTSVFAVGTPGTFDDRRDLWSTSVRSYFAFMSGFDESVTLLPGGRFPREEAIKEPGEPLVVEALVPEEAGRAFGVGVGDRIVAVPSQPGPTPYMIVVVSGLFKRNDPKADLWQIDDEVLSVGTRVNFDALPFHISEAAYFGVVGPSFSNMDTKYAWLLKVDFEALDARNALDVLVGITAVQNRLGTRLFGYQQHTNLDSAIRTFERRHFFTKLPIIVAMLVIVLVILYYIMVVSAMVVARQRTEIVLIRSRGASTIHVMTVFLLEGATMSVVAVVVGPLVAAAAVSALGFSPAFSELTGSTALPVRISIASYGLSALGGVLTLVALSVPAWLASRIEVATHRQELARPTRQSFFQRYYLDVGLLVVALFMFRQLTEQGSLVATSVFGDRVVDQVLLAMPGLILVASAMVLLRLLPLALTLASRVLSRWMPVGPVLGLWQMARNPTHYSRLSLLLILTAGLGIFVASVGGTLARSFKDRVFYATGSELRVEGIETAARGFTEPFEAQYLELDGVAQVVGAYRGRAFDLTEVQGVPIRVFAVDIDQFEDVAWLRDDFSDDSMDELLPKLKYESLPNGIRLPLDTQSLVATVKADRSHSSETENVELIARIRDANGRYFSYSFGRITSGDWTTVTARLLGRRVSSRNRGLFPVAPYDLVSIVVSERSDDQDLDPGWLMIDQVRALTGSEANPVVETFDDASEWSILRTTAESVSDTLLHTELGSDGDSGSMLFAWSGGRRRTSRGLFHGPPVTPLPVLASSEFMKDAGHSVGEVFTVTVGGGNLDVLTVAAVDYFPTLDTLGDRWLIADLASLTQTANVEATYGEIITANEVWLNPADGVVDISVLAEGLRSEPFPNTAVHDRQQGLLDSEVDPLLDAGWRSMLLISFLVVLLLSCLGLLLHGYVSFQERGTQFALLRSMGLSSGQLNALMWLEQSLVVAVGIALGTWMGGRLSATIMPFLGHSDTGGAVLPPFAPHVEWVALLVTYAVIAVIFAAIVLAIIFIVRRSSLQQALRLGEM